MTRMAETLWNWGPRVDAPADLDLTGTPDWSLTPWAESADSSTRTELSEAQVPRFRHIFGLIGSIAECVAENMSTPFKFEAVANLPFKPNVCGASGRVSYVLARILAYISNALITYPCPLTIGDPVVGVLTAAYGRPNRAILDVWRP